MRPPFQSPILILAYGNTLRSDDGAGPALAQALPSVPGVEVRVLGLLTPDLVPAIVAARKVIFVDAAVGGDTVQVRAVQPSVSSQVLGHAASPELLLAMARDLYDRTPPAWLVTIPAVDFDFGERLSPVTQAALPEARAAVVKLLEDADSPPATNG